MATTIAISSTYGADGAQIGLEVAERLGLEFYDRAIPVAVASELAIDPEEAIAKDWRAPGRIERLLSALASVSTLEVGMNAPAEVVGDPTKYQQATESVLRKIADGEGGVILGRGAAIVLARHPQVLRVRLDGPLDARIERACRQRGIDEATARREQKETDAAREAYLRAFYGESHENPRRYHLVIDSTAIDSAVCVEIILLAASSLRAASD